MLLTEVECRHFRCLQACRFLPQPGLNVVRGDNAQGKTTLLEAILFAATTRSHRTSDDRELASYGQDAFHLKVSAQRQDRDVLIECHWYQGIKRFKVNGVPQTRLSDILGRLHVVMFSPEDTRLVQGGAGARRRFLDMEISQVDPSYLQALQHYRQALRQRNELLRAPAPDPALLSLWDRQLAEQGALIVAARASFIEQLSRLAGVAYGQLARDEPLRLAYRPDIPPDHDFEKTFARQQASDIRRKLTQRGPHRDDLEFLIDERPARSHASQGQQKSAALALKLAELELVGERVGERPVLLLDEVLAELDEQRSRRLFEAVDASVQCIATTTEQQFRSGRFGQAFKSFRIHQGELEEERAP